MTDLTARVRTALGSKWETSRSPWEELIRLYETDPEAFYLLASDELGGHTDPVIESLAVLARRIRKAIRASYRLIPPSGGDGQVETNGDCLPVPTGLFPRVQQFLLEIDGKGVTGKKGKDYEGRVVSHAEVRFKLGEPSDASSDEEKAKAGREARPMVFRVSPEDLASLKSQPAYVTHNLLKCAPKVILAPTAIYRGLNRGDDALKRLKEGWAICGKPNRACDNEGKLLPVPSGMVFMAYADSQGFVFDWDWVQEDNHSPGYPLNVDLRFGNAEPVSQEMVLDLPTTLTEAKFDATVATYSERGDCVFCYICDECSYAERINPDLTIFRAFGSNEVTGFKIKNVRRIFRNELFKNEKGFVSDDAPDLTVSVRKILLATLKTNQKTSVEIYDVIIEAFQKVSHPPAVHVPTRR